MTDGRDKEDRLRILVLTGCYEPGFRGGGPVRSVAQIVATAPDNADIWMITSDRDVGSEDPYPGLSGRWITQGRARVFYLDTKDPRMWAHLLRIVHSTRFDIVYVNSLWSPMFTMLPVVAARLGLVRASTILLAPRGELDGGALAIRPRKKRAVLRLWSPFLRSLDPVIHASTETEAESIRRALPWADVEVCINQVDLPAEPLPPMEMRTEAVRLVFISRISRKKNLDLALRALESQVSSIDFDIFGPLEDPDYWSQCLQLVRKLPANVRVSYQGELPPSRVAATFNQYEAFIFPTHGENFGHVIAESLSASCPVICSTATPWTNILNNGAGLAVDLNTTGEWETAISQFVNMAPRERLQRRQRAGDSYIRWRAERPETNILELVASRLPW